MTTANAIRSLRETLERLGKEARQSPMQLQGPHPIGKLADALISSHAQILFALSVAEVVPEIERALKKSADQIAFSLARLAELRGEPASGLADYVERNTTLIAVRSALAALQSAKEPTP